MRGARTDGSMHEGRLWKNEALEVMCLFRFCSFGKAMAGSLGLHCFEESLLGSGLSKSGFGYECDWEKERVDLAYYTTCADSFSRLHVFTGLFNTTIAA